MRRRSASSLPAGPRRLFKGPAWREAAKADFLRNVALGIMGDAARANLLSRAQIDRLLGDELNPYAQRALSARRVLMDRNAVDAALIDALLNERAAWALHELLSRDDLSAYKRGRRRNCNTAVELWRDGLCERQLWIELLAAGADRSIKSSGTVHF